MEHLVSVVIPVYNVEQYLRRCLDSVIGQTYKQLEIILIDDGSTDASGAICDEYALKDIRIQVFHTENQGLSNARNTGVSYAQGEYLAFIDSDDYIAEDMIEVIYDRIMRDESDLVICNFLRVNNAGKVLPENADSPILDEKLNTEEALNKLCGSMCWYYVTAWNRLYRTELIREIPFPPNQINEDELIAHYLLGSCKSVSCVKKPLYYYVQSNDSITRGKYTIERLNAVTAMWDRCRYAAEHQMNQLAESSMDRGMFLYYEGYSKLDRNNEVVKKRFRQLHVQSKVAYNSINKAALTNKKKFLYLLFRLSDQLYYWLDRKVHVNQGGSQ